MEGIWRPVIIALVIVILIGSVVLILKRDTDYEITITPGSAIRENRIGVFGAVKEPGYYTYKGNIRIGDAAEMAGGLDDQADSERANLAKWVEDGETIIIPTVGTAQPTLTPVAEEKEMVDLNSADADELMKLPGIGKKRAEDIIKLRENKGRFTAKEELLEISGISENLLKKIYDRLIVQ